jgi:DNA repair exonuclease SbcCD ATPase subunit
VVDGSKFSDVQLAALKKEIDAKKAEITTLITSYKSMESANALRQTQITSAEASVKAIEADLKRVEQELSQYGLPPYGDVQELSSRVKALEEYEKTLIASISRRQQLLLSVEESKASIARWSQITNGSDTHAQAVKIMETADAVGTEAALAESAAADIAKLEAELAVVSGKLSSVGDHLENLQEEVGEIETLYPAYAGKLPDRLAELKKLQESYDMAKGALEEARKTLKAAEGEMQALEEKARKDGARRELVSDLKRLKEALGRGGVPSATVSDRFDAMAGAVAETLDSMCANFTVEPDKDSPVSFLFTRLDDESGDALPQSRLSGGQKVRLSIAFLLALHRLVVPDVGLLVLDEPSTHLDAEGVESLANMLTSLGAVMKDGGCQVFVVDHNEALTRAFTSGIKI